MKVLITGANGFIGKNLSVYLASKKIEVLSADIDTTDEELEKMLSECEFVYHLAGVNRPEKAEDFYNGNVEATEKIIKLLEKNNNICPVFLSSSVQAELENDYGRSKRQAENIVEEYADRHNVRAHILRLNNVFGKWAMPHYNSVVSTFCYNISRNKAVFVSDVNRKICLVYIDDLVKKLYGMLENEWIYMPVYETTLGRIVKIIFSFRAGRRNTELPFSGDELIKKLYSTYLSYLPENSFSYPLDMKKDNRGSFTEFFRTDGYGQVSVNVIKPNIIKGNHYHHTKNEKFLVVSGSGVIRFRKIGDEKVIEYKVSGDKLEVVDIPVGYTHNIENIGDKDMLTVIWCNECFDEYNPDTYFMEV